MAGDEQHHADSRATLTVGGTVALGEDTFTANVTSRGVGVQLGDYLSGLLGAGGFFASRDDSSAAVTKSLNQQISDGNLRLQSKQDQLTRQFTALETAMAQFQQQTAALSSAIGQLPSASSN